MALEAWPRVPRNPHWSASRRGVHGKSRASTPRSPLPMGVTPVTLTDQGHQQPSNRVSFRIDLDISRHDHAAESSRISA